MRKLLASLLSVFSIGAYAATEIKAPVFSLKLNGDWVAEKSDPDQFSYYSKAIDVGLTTSFVRMNAKPSDTERIANKLKEFRLAGENRAASEFNLRMTIADPIVVPFSKGHQVAYFGHDDHGRQFRYVGLVFPDKTINVYAESKTRSQGELEKIFNDLLKGLSFQ
ncbi:hypothetical protein HNP49_002111 [Pseudomonas fluvialis]|uniref:DUF1795 domain-containing protein n=1 Tax=Pseudomonas fluvialis TaxID=1793966 RepID=A0A7X0ES59_9PSED|nr:hypothetical protein [Pseudomonas fluvialis]MBB6341943.1 hypothetical protein [Pseudomonas fluvialis]